ncbi:MAG: hypothetical protein RLZZ450_3754 [Pseudomonadota bacterium]|jgi:hypothetical protein
MAVTVIVNHLTVVHKGSGGIATAGAPDVCNTPSPSGPMPMPYPNVAKSADLALGTIRVTADGQPVATKDSCFMISTGDEAGSLGGVVSGVFKGKAKFVNYSMDVKFEGKNVARLSDPMTMNGNQPNTLTPAELQQANLVATLGKETTDLLCIAFCWCNKHGEAGSEAGKGVVRTVGPNA